MPPKAASILIAIFWALVLDGWQSQAAIIAADSFRPEPTNLSEYFSLPIHQPFIARIEFESLTKRMVEEILLGKIEGPILYPAPLHQKPALRTVVHRTDGVSRFTRPHSTRTIITGLTVTPSNDVSFPSSRIESATQQLVDQILYTNSVRIRRYSKGIRPYKGN
jgi:hypothetical protein